VATIGRLIYTADRRKSGKAEMKNNKYLPVGLTGTVLVALCCFTPALVLLLGALGLSAFVGWWLDLILFPALAIFMAIAAYGFYLRRRANAGIAADAEND
jgi:mercuric ion transport protein